MKVSLQLTMDGLVRALRQRAHALADEIEDEARHGRQPERRPEQRALETEVRDARSRD